MKTHEHQQQGHFGEVSMTDKCLYQAYTDSINSTLDKKKVNETYNK